MRLTINLERSAADYIAEFSSGAKLYLDSASSEGGSYSNVTSTALVSGTEQYELNDSAGTSSTWYKARVGNSAGSTYGSYGAAFQGTSWLAYATLQDLLETVQTGASETHHNLLADLLADVSRDVDTVTLRTFLRVPQVSGTETFYLDVHMSGQRSLSIATSGQCTDGRALDIVSITSLYTRDSETGSYVEIASGDTGYYLQPGYGPGVAGTDWPYEDVVLSPAATVRTTWPTGFRAVKVIGVRGFPAIPRPVKRAVISEARERFRQSIGGGASPAGVNQFGTPILLTGDSPDMRRVMRHPYRKGFEIA